MKLIYLKSALKCDSFDLTIVIKILFFRVLVTIEPGHSLLQFVTKNCLIHHACKIMFCCFGPKDKNTIRIRFILWTICFRKNNLFFESKNKFNSIRAKVKKRDHVSANHHYFDDFTWIFYLFNYYY